MISLNVFDYACTMRILHPATSTTNHYNPMNTEKVKLPAAIETEMNNWRNGFVSMPDSYIAFHKELAEKELEEMGTWVGLITHSTEMKSDGWCDGMRVLHAVVEDTNGRLFKLHWHDGNQEFFENYPVGGSGPYRA